MESNAWVENVSTVQRLYAAFGRGDIGSVIAALSPDVVWGEPDNPFNPAAGTWRGHAGFLEWASIGRQSEEILRLEPRQFIAQGDMVAVVGHTACIARPTGRGYETDFVHLVTLRGGEDHSLPRILRHLCGGRSLPIVSRRQQRRSSLRCTDRVPPVSPAPSSLPAR